MKQILCLLFIFSLYACKSTDLQPTEEDCTRECIDLDQKQELSMYELFSAMEIIPLETTKASVLGNPLRKIVVNKGLFYVLDYKQDAIVVFDSQGKYLRKIDKYGNGPEEYTHLYDFGFNRFDGNLELMSAAGYINVYDSLGVVYKHTIKLPSYIRAVSYFANMAPDRYLFFCTRKEEEKKLLIYDRKEDKIVSETYSIPEFIFFNTPYHHSYSPFYVYADTVCFVQSYNGDVFWMGQDGELTPRYLWDFMDYNFDISTLKEETIEFYVKHQRTVGANYATSFLSYGENSKYYITSFRLRKKIHHLIIDKANGKHLVFNTFKEGGVCFPLSMDETAVYFYASPSELHIAVNSEILNDWNRKKYDAVQPDDNPLIIKYTFK